MSSTYGVQHANAKAHLAGKPTPSSFAFDPDSAIMYAVVNLASDKGNLNASDPAKSQSVQTLSSMKPDSHQQHVDGEVK